MMDDIKQKKNEERALNHNERNDQSNNNNYNNIEKRQKRRDKKEKIKGRYKTV